jgi:hypothetical protein
MEVNGLLHALAALPRGKIPGTHWVGSLASPRACVDAVERRQFLNCEETNPDHPTPSLSLYRLRAVPAPGYYGWLEWKHAETIVVQQVFTRWSRSLVFMRTHWAEGLLFLLLFQKEGMGFCIDPGSCCDVMASCYRLRWTIYHSHRQFYT